MAAPRVGCYDAPGVAWAIVAAQSAWGRQESLGLVVAQRRAAQAAPRRDLPDPETVVGHRRPLDLKRA